MADYISRFRVRPGTAFDLGAAPTRVDGLVPNEDDAIKDDAKIIAELARVLQADARQSLLIVLQGMDTSGKDGVTGNVFSRTPPINIYSTSFKAPTSKELAHDYLWRVHQVCPAKGMIGVFNRSHYEDVLVVKVRGFAPPKAIEQRYDQINDFERMLTENGTKVLKFMLHISRETQGERLRDRLVNPQKRWKFNEGDLDDRKLWPAFMQAYETMVRRTSSAHAPWHVIPSDDRGTRNAIIANIVRREMEAMDLSYPDSGVRPGDFQID